MASFPTDDAESLVADDIRAPSKQLILAM